MLTFNHRIIAYFQISQLSKVGGATVAQNRRNILQRYMRFFNDFVDFTPSYFTLPRVRAYA